MGLPETQVCPDCGQELPMQGVAGLCPLCLLRQGAAGDTVGLGSFTPPSVNDLETLFPQLEIIELIGRGGMGAVYKVRQRELDRVVALKILPPGMDERPGFAERFTREAKALAKLSHPGIVTIHDTGRVEGLYYLLMEYVDGVNLRQLQEDGRISLREALAIVPMICDALQYAHDAGLVHRDIKPENILLDRNGRVKVADFGLAKLVGIEDCGLAQQAAGVPFVTEAGQVMGTPQYMAPEQIAHPNDVDHRADIYSLGVVLYQMLTGELPGKVWAPPSTRSKGDVRLDEVVQRAMQKNPVDRYQQASQVKEVVETIIHTPQEDITTESKVMEITFNCPGCEQKLSVDESAAGMEVSCPSCTQTMIVPSATIPHQPLVPVPPPPKEIHASAPPPPPPPSSPGWTPKSQTIAQTAYQTTQAKGWAVWALVLGLCGLIPAFGIATGLVGLVFGIVALVKKTTSRGLAIGGIVAGGVAALLIPFHLSVLDQVVAGAKFGAGKALCAQNLKDIGEGISEYRSRNNGAFPPSLKELAKQGLIKEKSLRCPLNKDDSGGGYYVYVRPSGAKADGLVVWPKQAYGAPGQEEPGRNVLDTELKVRFLTEDQFRKAAKATPHGPGFSPQAPPVTKNTTPPRNAADRRKEVREAAQIQNVDGVLQKMKTAKPDEMRGLLVFLLQIAIEDAKRDEVTAAVKPLLNDIENGNMAFQVFVKWADKNQVPDLIEMLRVSPNSARGKECMKILSRLGDMRAAEALASCLTDFHLQRDVKAALVSLGAGAKPVVIGYYFHKERHVREAARELLRGYGVHDDEVYAESKKALEAHEVPSRWEAVDYLSSAKLTDEQKAEVARSLRPLIEDDDLRLRDFARKTLAKYATKADADFLFEKAASEDEKTWRFAVELLVQFKDVRVAKPLAKMLSDRNESYRAGNSLIQIGSIAEREVIPYLSSEDAFTRQRAADVLAKIGTTASLPALQTAAKSKDFFAKAAAETAIGEIKGRSTGSNTRSLR